MREKKTLRSRLGIEPGSLPYKPTVQLTTSRMIPSPSPLMYKMSYYIPIN